MKQLFSIAIIFNLSFTCVSQSLLVKDVNVNPSQIQAPNNYSPIFIKSGDLVYFPIADSKGKELWSTDGTKAGTRRIKDLNPGLSDGYKDSAVPFLDKLFFSGNDGVSGTELWATDGTDQGTVLVKDITEGQSSFFLSLGFQFQDHLYFSASSGLWKTDGTSSGTRLFFDLPQTGGSRGLYDWAPGVNIFYFFTNVYTNGVSTNFELWKSDGTELGTLKVRDFPYVSGKIIPTDLTVIGNTAYFSANDNGAGDKVWRSDGTLSGTYSIENMYGFSLVPYNGKLLFSANSGFWITDGGIGTAQLLFGSYFYGGTDVNGDFYAIGLTSIIRTDGTQSGTREVAQIGPTTMFGHFPVINNKIITAFNPSGIDLSSQEIGIFDIDGENISQLKEIKNGPLGSLPRSWVTINDRVLFLADDGIHGLEIWETNGTSLGTQLFLDTNPGTGDAQIENISVLNGKLFFLATQSNETGNKGLWMTDGEEATTSLYHSFSNAWPIGQLAEDLYYFDDRKLWKASGQPGGVQQLMDLSLQTNSTSIGGRSYTSNGKLFYWFGSFGGALLTGVEPWVTDGTPEGSHLLKDINPGVASSSSFSSATDLNSKLIFSANNGTLGRELWISDGTEPGTILLKDIFLGSDGSGPSQFVKFGSQAFFSATDGSYGRELWKTDGTVEGTTLVKDIFQGTGSSSPFSIVVLGDNLFFIAYDGGQTSLWKTNGTESGTTLIKSISNGLSDLTVIGNKLFFSADDGINGKELWVSDGTNTGTHLIEILPGPSSSNPKNFYDMQGACYFIADDKIWKSAGSVETTEMISDLLPTTPFKELNGWVYFGANSIDFGNELFKLKNKSSQMIFFNQPEELKIGDPDIDLDAFSSSGLPVSYTLSPTGIAELINGKVRPIKPGKVVITASQIGNFDFDPAPNVIREFCITPVKPIITIELINSIETNLSSNSEVGNFWYKNDVFQPNFTNQQIQVVENGTYKVKVVIDGCESPFSDAKDIVVTGLEYSRKIIVFPTIGSNELTILYPGDLGEVDISIAGISGVVVFEGKSFGNEKSIDLSPFSSGMYLIKICYGDKVEIKKIIKQ